MASSFHQRLVDPKKNFLARLHYMKYVANRLRKYGLDTMISATLCTICTLKKRLVNRLPREVVDTRNQSLKHAIDLSMKHEYLPADLQTPFRSYLQEMLALVSHMQVLVEQNTELIQLCFA